MRKVSTEKPGARSTGPRKARTSKPLKAHPANLPRFYQAEDVAAMTGLNVETIRRALRSGKLAAATQGKKYIISAPDLEAWYTSNGGKTAGV